MISIAAYILFFAIWLYALNRSVSHSGIETAIHTEIEIHWTQIVFGITICIILSGSVLIIFTQDFRYIGLTIAGTFLQWLIIAYLYFQMSWDERAMIYKKFQYMYLRLPRKPNSVLALEKTHTGKYDQILYWSFVAGSIIYGFFLGQWLYIIAFSALLTATAIVTSNCQFLQYAAVTQSQLTIRYGIPPFRVLSIDLKNLKKADAQAQKKRIQLTLEDKSNTFTLNLPPDSYVARLVVSHLKRT